MAQEKFQTAQGICIPVLSGVHPAYERAQDGDGWCFTVVMDARQMQQFLLSYCALLPAPGYFTLELPVEGQEDYDVYNVDGCSIPVLQAIVRRYGSLLVEDGDVHFGFAAHEAAEQLYVSDLKTVQIYTQCPSPVEQLLHSYQISEEPGCKTLWDVVSEENPCQLLHVEVEEESIFDLPDLLADAGIYLAGRREALQGKS